MTQNHFLAIFIVFFTCILFACNSKDYDACEECFLVADPGNCEAYIPRYYYDQDSSKCKEFIWGGCDGVVPFETLEECMLCGCF